MWEDGTGDQRRRKAFAGAVIAAIWAVPAAAQVGAQGEASALVLRPMSLTNLDPLDFGTIIPSAAAGYVTVDAAGPVTSSGGVIAVSNARPAHFAGQGSANRVVIKTGSSQIFLTGPGTQMLVDNFEFGNLSGLTQIGNGNNFRITSANGVIGFGVGARLLVNANQAGGDYSGSFTVTFNYQ